MSPIDFLTDLLNPDLAFLAKALAVAVMSSIVCGVVGSYVVLRGMAFIGDAVAHAVFPGLAVAFVVSGDLVLGGTVAGLLTAVLVALFSQNRRLKEDSIIGVLFVAAFALGVVVISQAPGYAGSLQQFLFGSIAGVPDRDLYVVAGVGGLVLVVMFAFHKEFVAISLDRESARAMGLRVFWFDLVLYVLVALAVVISVQTIGNILVLALLVTPAATARLLTDRLAVMMVLAPIIGGGAALFGLYLSWSWDLPTGGVIVLLLTAVFLLAWFGAPRHGLIAQSRLRARRRRALGPDEPGPVTDSALSRPTGSPPSPPTTPPSNTTTGWPTPSLDPPPGVEGGADRRSGEAEAGQQAVGELGPGAGGDGGFDPVLVGRADQFD
jgi:manganese/iron transport system permease protein